MKRYTILVYLGIDDVAKPLLEFAWAMSDRFDLDIIGFSAADVQLILPGDLDGSASAETLHIQMEAIEKRLKALKEEFQSAASNPKRASWRSEIADPVRVLASNARAADLIVMGTPKPERFISSRRSADPGELILSAGRPVLLASERLAPMKADRVLVAWKDTREARRAVADAMPFLLQAKDVLVVTADEGEPEAARGSAGDVAQYLSKHGVRARADVVSASNSQAAEALAEIAREIGSDLIVSGGYGHSRLREWAFGGVTRSLLRQDSVNRLISN